jgi:hypothetical protein
MKAIHEINAKKKSVIFTILSKMSNFFSKIFLEILILPQKLFMITLKICA